MFIIKLPPNPYYYANTNTAHHDNGIEDKNQKVRALWAENGFSKWAHRKREMVSLISIMVDLHNFPWDVVYTWFTLCQP